MKLLLDTHTALWLVNDHEKLSSKAKAMLLDDANLLYISIVSAWEIAIKASIGKLPEFYGGTRSFLAKLEEMPINFLHIELDHIETLEKLPFVHRDPFDRMLVAVAKVENMTILTADENIYKYDAMTAW